MGRFNWIDKPIEGTSHDSSEVRMTFVNVYLQEEAAMLVQLHGRCGWGDTHTWDRTGDAAQDNAIYVVAVENKHEKLG